MSQKLNILFGISLLVWISNAERTQYQEKYTLDERIALDEFRPIALNLVQKLYEKEDIYLIHFLRARNLKPAEAADMLQKVMSWRKENAVDDVLDDKEMILATRKLYPVSFGFVKDKVGRPASLSAFSSWDMRKGYLRGFDFKKFLIYHFEKISTMALLSGHSQYVQLIDLSQFSTRKHTCLACLSFYANFVGIYENNYPNMAYIHYVINAPRIFDTILSLVNDALTEHTSRHMKVFGVDKHEWQPAVLEVFNANELPRRFGGTKEGGFLN